MGFMVSKVSWSSWFHGFICFELGLKGLVVSCVWWFHRICGIIGFVVLHGFRCFMCFWFQTYGGFIVFLVLKVSWFQGFLGFMGCVVSWVSWFHWFPDFMGFMF